jgi:DNA processing protein
MLAMPKISAALRAARRRELAISAKASAADSALRLSRRQRLAWLRLIRSENVGPATFRALVNEFGGAEAAIAALPALSRRGGRSHDIGLCTEAEAEAELARADSLGITLVALGEPGYPPALAHVDAPPPLLYIKGRAELAGFPIVAIVGARNGSASGQKFTRQLAIELGLEGFVIASGLARGIDTAAHRSALEHGTIAVVAGGIDVVYPPENAELQEAIAERGLLISERPPGFSPRGKDFPRRNRLISGISLGVVVVEAAERSGSLITARLAGEQGREVFAVPGSPLDPRAAGTNNLLKQGACLVTSSRDIVETLAPILGRPHPAPAGLASGDERKPPAPLPDIGRSEREIIVEALGPSPVDIDELIRTTGIATRKVQIVLLELDLAGRLQRHGHQLVSLKSPLA